MGRAVMGRGKGKRVDSGGGDGGGKRCITPDGYRRLVDELETLRGVERPRILKEVADAAAEGDRSENASYIYGRKRLRQIDSRMRYLGRHIEASEVVDPRDQRHRDRVFFGATVELEDEAGEVVVYELVGPDDETGGRRISYRSPVGAALLGRAVDDEVVVETPRGQREWTVIEIRYPSWGG